MNTLSVVVITFNEEGKIDACLKSVDWADEIVVVDSFSTDKTVDICRRYTDKIFQKRFEGFAQSWNFALSKAQGDWIMVLSADQIVRAELQTEISDAIYNSDNHCGYAIPTKSYFLGKWIHHSSWYPCYKVRLFRQGKGTFTNRLVHEHISVDGRIGYLRGSIIHLAYDNLSQYLTKMNRYTSLEAEEFFDMRLRGKQHSLRGLFNLTSRKTVLKSYWWKYVPLKPLCRFLWMYLLKLGFLDGREGFQLAVLAAFSDYVCACKYRYLVRKDIRDCPKG